MLITSLLYLVLGAAAGLLAGLFGVGGGVIIVPVLIYAFTQQGLSVDYLTHLAVGTSLAVICISSLSSTLAHHKTQSVLWPSVRAMTPGILVGVVIGVYTVLQISGVRLQWLIGCYLILVAIQMGFNLMPFRQTTLPNKPALMGAGVGIGWLSAMFGIGGGSLTVPFLSYFGVAMRQAVATSAACGVPIAFMAVISNVYMGFGNKTLPEWSLGYVYLPAFIGIALLSAPFAKLGAHLAQRLPQIILKRSFATFLVIIGSSLIWKSLG
jgi:hypothetical protein